MKLENLLNKVDVIKVLGDIRELEIKNIYDHTEKVKQGGLFVAVVGLRVDSHNFIKKAEQNGAVALVVEKEVDSKLPQIIVKNSKIALSVLAGNFYEKTLKKLKIIGVVGTNGKTTTTYFIKDMLEHLNYSVGVIGTSGVFINKQKLSAKLTTPDTLDLFLLFETMQQNGVQVVVMEISAHAIYLHKIDGFLTDVAVFTNISKEHLDFFKTMEEYKKVKESYFNKNFCKTAVINIDDPLGKDIFKNSNLPKLSYSLKSKNANLYCSNLSLNTNSSSFLLHYQNNVKKVQFLIGSKYNVFNLLAAILSLIALQVPFLKIVEAISHIKPLEGRFKSIFVDQNCSVIIDFAHTTEALKQILLHLKKTANSKIICVFGCPGSRDHYKRKEMSNVAGKLSDYVILTSDNPDIENPLFILAQMEKGVKTTKCAYKIVENRALAIKEAFTIKKEDEKTIILLIGKGEEKYQIINQVYVPYNDEEEVFKIITKNDDKKGK